MTLVENRQKRERRGVAPNVRDRRRAHAPTEFERHLAGPWIDWSLPWADWSFLADAGGTAHATDGGEEDDHSARSA